MQRQVLRDILLIFQDKLNSLKAIFINSSNAFVYITFYSFYEILFFSQAFKKLKLKKQSQLNISLEKFNHLLNAINELIIDGNEKKIV